MNRETQRPPLGDEVVAPPGLTVAGDLTPERAALAVAEAHVADLWKVGEVILDLYEVKDIHEGGGMGLVYRVHHRGWDVDLAVKSPRPGYFRTEEQKQTFVREAETWIELPLHPHTASCYYVRNLGGIPRIFAEYVDGGSLREWIDDERLYAGGPEEALARILDIAMQMAWGLEHAHERGLIHQDVKPANVLMMPSGVAKVTDFGLANARAGAGELPGAGQSLLASFGGRTPAYCSPEQELIAQARAAGVAAKRVPKLTRRTDVWSWAVSVLEMFTGGVTWAAGGVAGHALEDYLAHGPERSEREVIPRMPEPVGALLRGCLRSDPESRPRGFGELTGGVKARPH